MLEKQTFILCCGPPAPPVLTLNPWTKYYKDTKLETSSLLEYNRVYRLEIQSVILVFSTGFVKQCPCNLLPGQLFPTTPPPFPCLNKYTVQYSVVNLHTYTVCKRRGEYGVIGGASDRYSHAAKYLCWPIFKKSRHLGFGVFIDNWSMTKPLEYHVHQ